MYLHDDVRTLTAELVRERCGRLPSVIVGSPPCQDASTANTKGRGVDGARTGLFFDAIRLVGEIRPAWACFENVPGIRTRGADLVISALEALDYTVWPLVVGAWHAGAPHRRNRVWFVAADLSRDGCGSGRAGRSDPGGSWQQQQALQGADAANAGQGRCEFGGQPRLSEPDQERGADAQRCDAGLPADANGHALRHEQGRAEPGRAGAAEPADDARHANRSRLAIGQGEPGDARSELSPTVRAIGAAWPTWNRGALAADPMDDGLSSAECRKWIAAYGDAVVPQITEAIGRSMMGLIPTDGAVLDLFAGAAGGWSLGMHRAGYTTIAACEIDPWRREQLQARYGGTAA